MPDSDIRRNAAGRRREGRRSLAAYGPCARGIRVPVDGGHVGPVGQPVRGRVARKAPWSAGVALALVYPLTRGVRRGLSGDVQAAKGTALPRSGGEGAECMKRKPSI